MGIWKWAINNDERLCRWDCRAFFFGATGTPGGDFYGTEIRICGGMALLRTVK
jgi:hypothetical protein